MTKRRKEKIIKQIEARGDLDYMISRAIKYGCLDGREALVMNYADKAEYFGWEKSQVVGS